MSDDIYLCCYCGGPIIFRHGDEHQPYHLGTGWDCWRIQNGEYSGSGNYINISGLSDDNEGESTNER
jgi:hypothetical protein